MPQDKVGQFLFEDLSDIEAAALGDALAADQLAEALTVVRRAANDPAAHRSLDTVTVLVDSSKYVLPVVATWLISRAPAKPRKETITFIQKDGTKITKVIEYHKGVSLGDMLRKMAALFE